jgi:predicted GNAT superfamily acetyltransferase
METNNIIYKSVSGYPENEIFKNLKILYQDIFEDADILFFEKRLKTQKDTYILLAYSNDILIGFKIGYPANNDIFYSWIGGVKIAYRNIGVGKELAKMQELWAIQKGFKTLKTKSMNRFKPMMILNLTNGFEITKVYTNSIGQTKIVFEKPLF